MDYFVGARTHATIAAFSQQVPTISLGYSVKAMGINQDIFGHTDWVLPVDHVTPETVLTRLQNLIKQNEDVREQYRLCIPGYIEKAWLAGSYLKNALAGDLSKCS